MAKVSHQKHVVFRMYLFFVLFYVHFHVQIMCSFIAGVFMWRKDGGEKKTQLSGNSQSVSRPAERDGKTQEVEQTELCDPSLHCLCVNHALSPEGYSQCFDRENGDVCTLLQWRYLLSFSWTKNTTKCSCYLCFLISASLFRCAPIWPVLGRESLQYCVCWCNMYFNIEKKNPHLFQTCLNLSQKVFSWVVEITFLHTFI